VLFSEPKIPQYALRELRFFHPQCFQCSSASRKFLNLRRSRKSRKTSSTFSALQRAENSSMFSTLVDVVELLAFQCSSASRKFLNRFGIWRCRAR